MRAIVITFVLFCGALMQVFLHTAEALGYAHIPVLTGLIIYYGLTRRRTPSLTVAFLAGILQDALSSIPLGFSSFCFCVAVWIVGNFREQILINDWVTHVLFGAIVNVCIVLALFLMLWQLTGLQLSMGALGVKLGAALLLGGAVVPLVYVLADSLYLKLGIDYRERPL